MTTTLKITSLFTILIDRAELSITRRALLRLDDLAELDAQIAIAADAPAEPQLIGKEERMLSECLLSICEAQARQDRNRERTWQQIAGVLLPVVREHFSAAIEIVHRQRPTTSDQDYTRRG